MATIVQLTGGAFQDSMGNVLANGYLTFKLSSDEEVNGSLICSGIEIRIQLDANGDIVTSPAQSVWGNDVLFPINSYYTVTGYTKPGQMAWGPNCQQVTGTGPFDVGTWIPNQVVSWSPTVQVPSLEVNGTPNALQTILNLVNSASVTFSDIGGGQVQATATAATFDVNGTPLLSTAPIDFVDSASVTFANPTAGQIRATAVPPPPSLPQPRSEERRV